MLSGALPCYGVYETLDGRHMVVAAPEEKFWQAFCEAVDRPDLIPLRMAFGRDGKKARAEVQNLFKMHPLSWWVDKLGSVDCCATPVLTLVEAMEDEQFQAREMFVTTKRRYESGETSEMTQFAFPIKISDFEFSVDRQAPARGEHTAEILSELGYSDEWIGELEEKGVV